PCALPIWATSSLVCRQSRALPRTGKASPAAFGAKRKKGAPAPLVSVSIAAGIRRLACHHLHPHLVCQAGDKRGVGRFPLVGVDGIGKEPLDGVRSEERRVGKVYWSA